MATATKRFNFNTDLESWVFTVGGASNLAGTRDTSEDSPNDSNAGTGVMQARRTTKNKSDGTPYWEWSGDWEALGVPAGATVTQVNLDYDWRCSEYTTGASSTTGPAELRDSGSSLRGTFSTSASFTATTSWATRGGTAITGLNDASNTSIRLRLNAKPNTGNSSSAAVTLRQDWVVVTITYITVHALSGTAAGTSVGAGQIAALFSLPGNIAASSSAVGSLAATRRVAGQSQGVSSAAGGLALLKPLAGQTVATSSGAAQLVRNRTLAGEVTAWSSGASTLQLTWALGGASSGASSAAGVLAAIRDLAGQIVAESTAIGGLGLSVPLAGLAFGASSGTAQLALNASLDGNAAGMASLGDAIAVTRALAGFVVGASTGTAAMTALRSLTGVSGAQAVASAALLLRQTLTCIANGFSSVIGDFVIITIEPGATPAAARTFLVPSERRVVSPFEQRQYRIPKEDRSVTA